MANWIYANARARAKATKMLGQERIGRMLECSTVEDALKILSEVNFGEGQNVENAVEFERLISAEYKNFCLFLTDVGSPEGAADFFLLKNDFHNAEAFIKAKYLKIDCEQMLTEDGRIEKSVLKDKIMTDDYLSLPDFMVSALLKCDAEFTSGKANGASINAIMTRGYYSQLYRSVKADSKLKKIYKFKVDCINIGVAIRTRNFVNAREFFIDNGSLSDKQLRALCEEPLENLKESFRFGDYKEAIELVVDAKLKGQPLTEFEKLSDGFARKFLGKERFSTQGCLPYMLYCFDKMAEIENVRIILVGLMNGLDSAEVKNKLR